MIFYPHENENMSSKFQKRLIPLQQFHEPAEIENKQVNINLQKNMEGKSSNHLAMVF